MASPDRAAVPALSRFRDVGRRVIEMGEADDPAKLPTILAYLDELLPEVGGELTHVQVMTVLQAWAYGDGDAILKHIADWREAHGLPRPV